MKQNLNYEVVKTFKPSFDSNHDYLIIKAGGTTFCCNEERFEEYILNCPEKHWQEVEGWINENVMPYMTRKSINYDTDSSYSLKHKCERCVKNYVAEELILYILASKGIPGENHKSIWLFPITLYYPLSSRFNKHKAICR